MLTVIADDKIPFLRGVLEPFATMIYLPGGKITNEDLKHADALLTRTRTKCSASLLEGTSLKFIASATIGYDHIDTQYCDRHGIAWTNAPGCNSESVAQYITSLLLSYAVRTHSTLKGQTIGVVGVGNVGSKVARDAAALGMNVLLNDPPRARKEGPAGFVSLETIQTKADFITMHVPLYLEGEDRTFHLADEAFFNHLGNKPFFINASRGEVCDNNALKTALKNRQLCGAALDVWENEPDIDLELLNMLDFATPHIAGYSADGKSNGTAMSIMAFLKFFGLEKQFDVKTLQTPPLPQNREIVLENNDEASLLKAVAQAYDITSDDQRLRATPSEFEKLRGSYPFRREFDSYIVQAPESLHNILSVLRFNLK